jgi:flagellar biosynthesis/type III secretory pathway protein FliH
MDVETKPYLLTEAASLTGLSVDALRKRIARKRLRGSRSNEDGQWRVWLTAHDVETAKLGQSMDKLGLPMDNAGQTVDESRTIKALEAALAEAREALTKERERANQVSAEREAARIAAAAAEGELKGLREALAEARRPFWRRWVG